MPSSPERNSLSGWRELYQGILDTNLQGQHDFIEQHRADGLGTAIETSILLAKKINPMITIVGNEDVATMEFAQLANSGTEGVTQFLNSVLTTIYADQFQPGSKNKEALIRMAGEQGLEIGNPDVFAKWVYHYAFGMKIGAVLKMLEGISGMDTGMLGELIDIEGKPGEKSTKKVLNLYKDKK